MIMNNAITLFVVVVLFSSAFCFFTVRFVIYYYLVKRGVKIIFGLAGLPGYLEYLYFKSDKSVRSSKIDKLIVLLVVSFCLMTVSALSLVFISSPQ